MRVRVVKVVKFQDNFLRFFLSSKSRKKCATLFHHFCRETFFLQKCMILYHRYAKISCGLYIYCPFFEDSFFVFKEFLSENSVLMYHQYSRVICNQDQVMMARIRQYKRLFQATKTNINGQPIYSFVSDRSHEEIFVHAEPNSNF